MPWVGEGQINLGKLPAGKDDLTLVVPPKELTWTLPPPQKIALEILNAPK
jgi:hypothetical protein